MLESYDYEVSLAKDSQEAFELLSKNTYHLLLLDINLPTITGFEICQELRKVSTVPVIFASARTSEDDRIIALDIGGDDYLTKPYSMKELLSRRRALLRRTYGFSKEGNISFGDIVIQPDSRTVMKCGKEITLSLKEYDVLYTLAKQKNTVIKKEVLLTTVWGAFCELEPSTLTVHIRWLREKIEDIPAQPKYL
ncbi:MAG: response regulator transcription factor, partial [Coprobacillaceae bacterium]